MPDLMKLARAAAEAARKREPASTPDTPAANAPPLPPKACATCAHYTAIPGKAPDGWCRKHRTETWGAYAGGCAADWTPADPATRTLERRRSAVVARLEADPALRYSFDVQGASPERSSHKDGSFLGPRVPAPSPVSVLLGLRTADGQLISGELLVPGDKWPGLAVFAAHWERASQGAPS